MRDPASTRAHWRHRASGHARRALTTAHKLPPAAAVLRRGLLVWGWGHLAIGDRRGWLLVVLQPLAIIAFLVVAIQLIDGTRWLVVFPPLALLLVAWLAQAVHAYRRAVELGASPGGTLQVAVFLPLAVAALSAFWLLGGRHGSPSATLEAYAVAWMSGHSEDATHLYAAPPAAPDLANSWATQSAYLTQRIATLAAQFGPTSGLDPTRPFDNLRFSEPVATGQGRQTVEVDIVRRQRVETTVLGIVPTASQETVVVEPAGTVTLTLVPEPAVQWLPFGRLDSFGWRIESVAVGR